MKTAVVKLIARVRMLKSWQKINKLPNHWIDPTDLRCITTWLNSGTDIIFIGAKGVGKTSLCFELAEALGWQDPYKVDVYTIKRTTDLFGTDAASNGSTHFVRSGLLDYIDRATISLEKELDTHFLLILDEINRVHAKVNESLHGLFDDTRQVTIPTAEGSKTIRLPPNLHVIGTMNVGSSYLGTHQLDEALKDRFAPITLTGMPKDYEVTKLVKETGILERQALDIVEVATLLREAEAAGILSSSVSYRGCRRTAQLILAGMKMKTAIIKGLLGWYQGGLTIGPGGEVAEPNSEMAKAFSALRVRGIVSAKDISSLK
jgi:MoxR-like ATPase